MGQYYKAIVLGEDGEITHVMSSYDFDAGAKLTEHSWLDNDFVAAFETLLVQEAPVRVVWAGDYADPEVDAEGNPRVIKSDLYTSGEGDATLYALARDLDAYRPDVTGLGQSTNYNWQDANGNRRQKPEVTYVIDPEVKANAFPVTIPRLEHYPFLINWDKEVFVDKRKVPAVAYYWSPGDKQALHPLPILTAEGNGRGGGDFNTDGHGDRSGPQGNFELIGSWARDHISLGTSAPEGFEEVIFDLIEMGHESTPTAKRKNAKIRKLVAS